MALAVDFTVEQEKDNKSLLIFESTSSYNSDINTGGYGGLSGPSNVNPFTTDVTSVTIDVILPNGTVVPSLTFTPSINSLPSLDPEMGYEISNVALGLGASELLPDGIYTISYTVSGTFSAVAFTSSASYQFLIKGQAQDCVNKRLAALVADVDMTDCGCEQSEALIKTFKLNTFLKAAKDAASCGKANKAKALLDYVTANCNDDCEGC